MLCRQARRTQSFSALHWLIGQAGGARSRTGADKATACDSVPRVAACGGGAAATGTGARGGSSQAVGGAGRRAGRASGATSAGAVGVGGAPAQNPPCHTDICGGLLACTCRPSSAVPRKTYAEHPVLMH